MATITPVKIELSIESNVLSERQLARVASLTAARNVLIERGLMSAGKADPVDLVNLAMFIESGEDPYALDPVREAGPAYPPCSTAKGWGECVLADGHEHRETEHRTESGEPVLVQWAHIDRYGHHWGVSKGADL